MDYRKNGLRDMRENAGYTLDDFHKKSGIKPIDQCRFEKDEFKSDDERIVVDTIYRQHCGINNDSVVCTVPNWA
jgi:hypothetical protein